MITQSPIAASFRSHLPHMVKSESACSLLGPAFADSLLRLKLSLSSSVAQNVSEVLSQLSCCEL